MARATVSRGLTLERLEKSRRGPGEEDDIRPNILGRIRAPELAVVDSPGQQVMTIQNHRAGRLHAPSEATRCASCLDRRRQGRVTIQRIEDGEVSSYLAGTN